MRLPPKPAHIQEHLLHRILEHKNLSQVLRSSALISALTLVSRILGFVRDLVLARVFGADWQTDVFFVAFKIPNFLRRLFGEGAFNQAFVPALSNFDPNAGREPLKSFIDRIAGTLAVMLFAITATGVIAAPLLIWLFAPGFAWNGNHYDLSVEMLRITFPYLFFVVLTAFAGSILNTCGQFALPALTPVVLNLCLIAGAICFAPCFDQPVLALAWAVFVAGTLQLLIQFPALRALGLFPRPRPVFSDPEVRRTLASLAPATFGVSVTQINLLLDTLIATFLVSGSVSWLYYSDRLVEFPTALFGLALATAILPTLSKNHLLKDTAAFSDALDFALKWVVLIGLPATLGLVFLAEGILASLFQYNEFSQRDLIMTTKSMSGYSIGLLPFMLIKVLVPGFSSRHDFSTPLRYGLYSVGVNLILSIGLALVFAHAGLAFATSLAAVFNASLLLRRLLIDRIYQPRSGWLVFALRILAANVSLCVLLVYANSVTDWPNWGAGQRFFNLALWILLGCGVYFATLFLCGLRRSDLTMRHSINH